MRSSSRRCVSEGFKTNGTVLKDFLSGASVVSGSATLTITELNAKNIAAAIARNINGSVRVSSFTLRDSSSLTT
jgi:hypothetical protein